VTIDEKPRLCGGTFFVLLLQALKNRKGAREHYKGDRDGLSDPEVLIGLIKVINPDYEPPRLDRIKTKTNDFKACKLSKGEYLPFGNTPEVEAFDERIRTDYRSALISMTSFVEEFLDLGESVQKDVRLVKALIELVQCDDSIAPDEKFFICEDGRQIKKAALGGLTKVCYPAFLLGIWHYVVVHRKDNSVGKATYDEWCPENGGGLRNYSARMGKGITADIRTYMPELKEADTEPEDETASEGRPDNESNEGEQEEDNQSAAFSQQVINNPLFIQQNGDNNTILPNYGTVNLTIGGKKGAADE
jgi:hypothetical protein